MIFEELCIGLRSLASTKVLLDKLFRYLNLIFLNSAVGLILLGQYKS